MHAVERMGEVGDPVLLVDGGQRVAERKTARDLVAQVEADHLALPVRLDLLPGDDGQRRRRRHRLERAAEDVVVGDRDRPKPLGLSMSEQVGDVDRAVVRPGGVQVEIADDPVTAGQRLVCSCDAASFCQLAVERVMVACKPHESVSLRTPVVLPSFPLAKRVVFREASRGGTGELRLRP